MYRSTTEIIQRKYMEVFADTKKKHLQLFQMYSSMFPLTWVLILFLLCVFSQILTSLISKDSFSCALRLHQKMIIKPGRQGHLFLNRTQEYRMNQLKNGSAQLCSKLDVNICFRTYSQQMIIPYDFFLTVLFLISKTFVSHSIFFHNIVQCVCTQT